MLFLLFLSYLVVLAICLRSEWEALTELGSETLYAMGFIIIGLTLQELTGMFLDLKHELAIGYLFIGFYIVELVKPTAAVDVQDVRLPR